jgi:hypothetical protein
MHRNRRRPHRFRERAQNHMLQHGPFGQNKSGKESQALDMKEDFLLAR